MISIIIPTYNRASLIGYTLESIGGQQQPGVDMEIIVIDDGSTDGTMDLVRNRYTDVILIKNKEKGASAARNAGLAIAKGDYILYLDSDDLIGYGYLDRKIEFLDSNPDVTAVYGRYEYFESDGGFADDKIMFKHKYPLIEGADESAKHITNYLGGNYIPQNAIVWRRDFLLQLNGHDRTLLVNQDVELVIRAFFSGMKLKGIDDDTKVYIRHHTSDTRVGSIANSIPKLQNVLSLRRRIFDQLKQNGYNSPESRKALSTYLFNFWRSTRHFDKPLANDFLQLSKQVCWPVEIKGNIVYRTLAKMVGPVKAVEAKYFLLKRD